MYNCILVKHLDIEHILLSIVISCIYIFDENSRKCICEIVLL